MHKYLKVINLEILCAFILPGGARFCLQTGIPNNSYEVWKTGFYWLGLLPEAVELLKKEKTETLIDLINKSKNIEDITIIASAKDAKKLQEAAEERIKFLTN